MLRNVMSLSNVTALLGISAWRTYALRPAPCCGLFFLHQEMAGPKLVRMTGISVFQKLANYLTEKLVYLPPKNIDFLIIIPSP